MGGKPLDNRRKSASFWIKCALLVSALCLILYFREDIASLNLRDLVANSGNRWIAALTVQALFVVKTLLPFIPANALCLACAMVFDLPEATLLCLLGMMIESILGYLMGRRMGKRKVQALLDSFASADASEEAQLLMSTFQDNQPQMVVMLRLSPFAIEAVSLVMGALRVDPGAYLLFSGIGTLPKILIMLGLGELMSNALALRGSLVFCLGTLLYLLLGLLVYFSYRRRVRQDLAAPIRSVARAARTLWREHRAAKKRAPRKGRST